MSSLLWRHGETILFWVIACCYLIPVWSNRYLPTQDGPSHLENAQILRDYGKPGTSYDQYFEIRQETIPNWTSHLLLAGLMFVVPPLVAEKILVSLYVLGLAGAFRYFLGSFGERCRPLSWLVFLFVYNRCLWMGFYNFCLSLVLVGVIWGYCVRRRGAPGFGQQIVLMLLFIAVFFTHLLGFLLALTGALGAALLLRPRSFVRPVLVCLAVLPAGFLTWDYLEQTGFFRSRVDRLLMKEPLALATRGTVNVPVGKELTALGQEIFGHHARHTPLLLLLVAFGLVTSGFALADWVRQERPAKDSAGLVFPLLLGILLLGLYLLVPDHLGFGRNTLPQGGFLKARLALAPFLACLACFRESRFTPVRLVLRGFVIVLLGVNLLLVQRTVEAGNELLTIYTSGIEAVGADQRIMGIPVYEGDELVHPLQHAMDHYCLGNNNINLDNYEALTPHFPLKYSREGAARANQGSADILICWREAHHLRGEEWQEIFVREPLRIYRRRGGKPPS